MPFSIRRGTNTTGFLSQSERRGVERAAFFTERDVAMIAGLGLDHIRMPVDEEQLWDDAGNPDSEAFSLLDAALDWCEQYGLRAGVDLHLLRSHHFLNQNPPLFSDPAEERRFAGLWEQLSEHLRRRPVEMVAYELLNEAVASDPRDWNRVAMAAFHAVRRREPRRVIVLGSNTFNQTHTFESLEVPDDRNMILTFHYYRPMLITHYQATWWEGGFWAGPVSYPGKPIADADEAYINPKFIEQRVSQWSNEVWNRERITEDFALPISVAKRAGVPLYCGEWGAITFTPREPRLAWYRDMLSLFQEHDIAWANWDYSAGFAPLVKNGAPTEIAALLV